MNFGCQADVFQFPHHRQYFFVVCNKMRPLLTFIFLLTISACRQKTQTPSLTTDDLKYSAYSWHCGADTIEFYLAHYLDIDKNGHFIAMRHDTFMDAPKYFTGDITDSLKNLINKTFIVDNFVKDYSWKPEDNFIYDGFTYCLDYKKIDSLEKKIQFIPEKSPEQIKRISQLLDTLIYSSASNKIDSFNTKEYAKELSLFNLQISGPLPKMVKFTPPPKIKGIHF